MVEDVMTHSGTLIESGALLNPTTELGHWEYWGTPPTGVFVPHENIPRFIINNAATRLSEDRNTLNVNMEAKFITSINYIKVDVALESVMPVPLIDLSWE